MPHNFIEDMLAFEDTLPKSRESYVRAPFAYPGCKFDSLEYLFQRFPAGKIFVDVCGGSGVVTANAPDNYSLKVFNDRHAGVTAFFRAIKDPIKRQKIIDWLSMSVHSREEFIWCRDSWENCQDDVERAARWYYTVKTSFGSIGRNWGRATSGAGQQGRALHNSLELIPLIAACFKYVQVENLDAVQILRDYDSPDTVFYVDPDYIGTDISVYRHRVEHELLLQTIHSSKGYVAVSNYKNDLYDHQPWDNVHSWEVTSTIRSKVYNEGNNLEGKENVMGTNMKVMEMLYVKEAR